MQNAICPLKHSLDYGLIRNAKSGSKGGSNAKELLDEESKGEGRLQVNGKPHRAAWGRENTRRVLLSGRGRSVNSQIGDARLAHGGGDGLDRGAQRVQELGELPGAPRLPAFLHHEPGQGDHIGVEGGAVGHGGAAGSGSCSLVLRRKRPATARLRHGQRSHSAGQAKSGTGGGVDPRHPIPKGAGQSPF